MFELFSDIFACRDNALTRVDPRAKLLAAVALILAVVFSTKVFLPLAMALISLTAMLALSIPLRLVLFRLAGPMGIVLVIVVLQSFLTPGEPILQISSLGYHFAATDQGLWKGLLLGSKVIGAVSVVLLLSFVTPAYKIFHSLRWFRIPETWVEMALLVYRYTFALLDHAADVAAAQRTRLGYSSLPRSLASMGVLAGAVVTRSLDQALRTYEAMVLRGYRGGLSLRLGKLRRWVSITHTRREPSRSTTPTFGPTQANSSQCWRLTAEVRRLC
jgi:cobalt/nickel transport system permease protein